MCQRRDAYPEGSDAGIVEPDIDAAEAMQRGATQRLDLRILGHVGRHGQCGTTAASYLRAASCSMPARRAASTTVSPCQAKASAVARPMPRETPVMATMRELFASVMECPVGERKMPPCNMPPQRLAHRPVLGQGRVLQGWRPRDSALVSRILLAGSHQPGIVLGRLAVLAVCQQLSRRLRGIGGGLAALGVERLLTSTQGPGASRGGP
jgi:hypothetical protein